jgi:hypothetical protein
MYKVSPGNPFTPDIDTTQLAILVALMDGKEIPRVLRSYDPLNELLINLLDKEYLREKDTYSSRNMGLHITSKGLKRTGVYKTYKYIFPDFLKRVQTPQQKLSLLLSELYAPLTIMEYKRYIQSCESLIVYELNQRR